MSRPKTPPLGRFFRMVDKTESCWLWRGQINRAGGYGKFDRQLAHRFIYEATVGPIPAGFTIDHLCKNTRCVNPAHLEPVTWLENVRRGTNGSKTHCVRGHPLGGDNLLVSRVRTPHERPCRACRALYSQKYRARKRALGIAEVAR